MNKKEYKEVNRQLTYAIETLNQELDSKTQRLSEAADVLRNAYEERMSLMSPNESYDLLEKLRSGALITHLRCVSLDDLKDYVRRVFISSAPPEFIFRVSAFEPDEEYPNFLSSTDKRENFDDWSEEDEEKASGGPWWLSAFRIKGAFDEN